MWRDKILWLHISLNLNAFHFNWHCPTSFLMNARRNVKMKVLVKELLFREHFRPARIARTTCLFYLGRQQRGFASWNSPVRCFPRLINFPTWESPIDHINCLPGMMYTSDSLVKELKVNSRDVTGRKRPSQVFSWPVMRSTGSRIETRSSVVWNDHAVIFWIIFDLILQAQPRHTVQTTAGNDRSNKH